VFVVGNSLRLRRFRSGDRSHLMTSASRRTKDA